MMSIMNFLNNYLIHFVLIVLIPIYYYYRKIHKLEKFFKNFPTPPTEPFFGNARDFSSTSAFLKTLHRYTKKYGTMVHIKMGPVEHALICSDYGFLQYMLTNNKSFAKPKNLRFLEPLIGNGLARAEGDRWRLHRKLITPAFHFKILETFLDIFESSGNVLVEKLSKMSGSESLDIYPYITRCTLDIICETAMGTKIDVQNTETSFYLQSVKEMCRIFITRTMSIVQRYDICFRFTKDYYIQEESLKYLHGHTDRVISTKRKELKESKRDKKDDNIENKTERKVFLDLLLEATAENQTFTDKDIRDEVSTFMFAGHDTTSAASSLILFCLANHKDVQEKVLKEQKQIFGSETNPKVTYSTLQEMKYLECVIKESMRLYSPVPLFGRETKEDVTYNDMIVPKGTLIIIFSHGLHMNPKYYPDPEKLDPSRFEGTEEKQPFAYIPFSAGPRNCIGQKYAMLEIKSLIAKIVRNFELSPAKPHHDMNLAAETVLKSLNGVKVGVKLR